jgi:hypothetical protein
MGLSQRPAQSKGMLPTYGGFDQPDSPEKEAEKEARVFKQELRRLFAYYCDYSLDKGDVYIKQTNMIGLLKDCKLIREGVFEEKDCRIMMSGEN